MLRTPVLGHGADVNDTCGSFSAKSSCRSGNDSLPCDSSGRGGRPASAQGRISLSLRVGAKACWPSEVDGWLRPQSFRILPQGATLLLPLPGGLYDLPIYRDAERFMGN